MKATLKCLLIVVLISTFSCCTIQKRLFNKGYHIEWNRKFKRSIENNDQGDLLKTDDFDQAGEQLSEAEVVNPEFRKDSVTQTNSDAALDSPANIQSEESADVKVEKEKSSVKKPVEKENHRSKMYNRGNGGNVLLGLCTLVMICICAAMITALYSGELGLGAVVLIICFGWILVVFTLILIVLFIVRFIRNF